MRTKKELSELRRNAFRDHPLISESVLRQMAKVGDHLNEHGKRQLFKEILDVCNRYSEIVGGLDEMLHQIDAEWVKKAEQLNDNVKKLFDLGDRIAEAYDKAVNPALAQIRQIVSERDQILKEITDQCTAAVELHQEAKSKLEVEANKIVKQLEKDAFKIGKANVTAVLESHRQDNA